MAKYKDILGNTREYEDKTITISLERYNTLIIKEAIADGTVNVKEEAEAKLKELRGGENEPCCKCDSKQTNADRIRNMSDEELAEFIHKMEVTCFADIIGYANKDCGQGKISCRECRAKAPTILEWLQLEVKAEESEEKQ